MNIIKQQKSICKKYKAEYVALKDNLFVGVAKNLDSGLQPINGLRHPLEGVGTGWFLWAGQLPEDNNDFFIPENFNPMHAIHIKDEYPSIVKYLGLAPGWRFLVDDKGYEDVWYDENLLNI